MTNLDFINHYETLEVSPKASFDTIERVFRYLAKRYHPDSSEHGDIKKFTMLVEAYETLSDPSQRTSFDIALEKHSISTEAIANDSDSVDDDAADRHRLLTLFYNQRRRDMKYPGIGIATVEDVMGIPVEVLDFHIWYFQQKRWIGREEGGTLSITAEGVDKLESTTLAMQDSGFKRITDQSKRLESKSPSETSDMAPAVAS